MRALQRRRGVANPSHSGFIRHPLTTDMLSFFLRVTVTAFLHCWLPMLHSYKRISTLDNNNSNNAKKRCLFCMKRAINTLVPNRRWLNGERNKGKQRNASRFLYCFTVTIDREVSSFKKQRPAKKKKRESDGPTFRFVKGLFNSFNKMNACGV